MEIVNIVREHLLKCKVSYVSCTARLNYPYLGREDLHLFHPTVESLTRQSTSDFEWVLVDYYYHRRRDYFKRLKLPFSVKHVPADPNFWLSRGQPGVGAQYNKGLIYADGDLVLFGADGWVFPSNVVELTWRFYTENYFPMCWYIVDWSYSSDMQKNLIRKLGNSSPVKYDYYGFNGEVVEVDHRFKHAFENNDSPLYPHDYYSWFFSGCASASLESVLEVNGFDQLFDGDKMLVDVDLASRLSLAGYKNFLLSRDLYLIRPAIQQLLLKNQRVTVKCNYGLIEFNREHQRLEANKQKLTCGDVDWIKNVWCQNKCSTREFCMTNHPWQYPFEHKSGFEGYYSNRETFDLWLKHQQLIDLEMERELRLDGDEKYEVGTFIEA